MIKNIPCTKINNSQEVRLHLFTLRDSKNNFVKYELADYYDKFPVQRKYDSSYYHMKFLNSASKNQ